MEPSAGEIREQLDRILASDGFANADRMSKFLRYVVERSIAGESDQIKEYAIGVDVFGRDADYDPRLDSIVRVEARRLRSKVDEYYAGSGREDPVVIRLRRGGYSPAFERKISTAQPPDGLAAASETSSDSRSSSKDGRARAWRVGTAAAIVAIAAISIAAWRGILSSGMAPPPPVGVAVLPFSHYSTDPQDELLAARLTDGVTSELARLGRLRVVSHTSVQQFAGTRTPATEIARTLNADVLIEGTVTRTGTGTGIDVAIRLVSGRSNYKLWVETFSGKTDDPTALARRIAATTAPAILKSQEGPKSPEP